MGIWVFMGHLSKFVNWGAGSPSQSTWCYGFFLVFALVIFGQTLAHSVPKEKIIQNQILDPAVSYVHKKVRIDRGPIHVHLLRVKMRDPYIVVKPVLAHDQIGRLERTTQIAKRVRAMAAINGSFFEPRRKKIHLPIGLLVIDGNIITKSLLNRSALGITNEKHVMFGYPEMQAEIISLGTGKSLTVWGINRPRKKDEVIIYTDEYGPTTQTNRTGIELIVKGTTIIGVSQGNTPIPEKGFVISCHGSARSFTERLPVGSEVILKFALSGSWGKALQIITGGPRLIQDGNIVTSQSVHRESFQKRGLLRPTARTAVGATADGELLFCVIDRKKGWSIGATFSELARLLKHEGAMNALALDGGFSSTLAIQGKMVNTPIHKGERMVSNAPTVKVLREFEEYRGEKVHLREHLREKRLIEHKLKRYERQRERPPHP